MKRTIAVVTLLFALTLMALAHGKEKHVMGTVTSISDSSVTVETTAKKSVTVQVSDKAKFEKSGAAATLKDLKVGDKVQSMQMSQATNSSRTKSTLELRENSPWRE